MSKKKKNKGPVAAPSLVVSVEENAKGRLEALVSELQSLAVEKQRALKLQETIARRTDQVSGAINELKAVLGR